jgi:hypothetical protein
MTPSDKIIVDEFGLDILITGDVNAVIEISVNY